MGRETKYLLALLGLLAGVFLGVVSLKLFVPRPPEGAGPDVHGDIATAEPQTIVEPPALSPPPALADSGNLQDQSAPAGSSRFGGRDVPVESARDPFVVAASYEATDQPAEPPLTAPGDVAAQADPPPPADLLPPPSFDPAVFPLPPHTDAAGDATEARLPLAPPPFTPDALPSPPLGSTHVAQAGDSWWSLAERAYGDGRLYRALFAWNRTRDPRVSLAPGTRLEIPPAAQLGASWPALLPRD
ncbi:MAG: LysM peptidoglycan-binding domain-containing protein [Planctomycetota bacterium]